jgi:hypothetical protein
MSSISGGNPSPEGLRPVATSLYAATMVLVSLLLLGMWFQAVHKGFIESGQGPGQWWREVVPVAVAAWQPFLEFQSPSRNTIHDGRY